MVRFIGSSFIGSGISLCTFCSGQKVIKNLNTGIRLGGCSKLVRKKEYNMENGEYQKKVLTSLIRLETKMDSVCKGQDDHEKRIRFLEKGIWVVIGFILIAEIILRFLIR